MDPLSPRNARVQEVRRLARQSRHRADRRAFVVEGATLVSEALEAGYGLETVFHAGHAPAACLARARVAGVDVVPVQQAAMEAMATTVTPQPVIAVAEMAEGPPLGERLTAPGHVVVLDRIQDPGNAGTILRSAEASGVVAVVFGRGSVDVHNPKVVRASAGAIFRVPIHHDPALSTAQALDIVAQSGRPIYATAADAPVAYDDVDLANAAIVMGNEAGGVGVDDLSPLDGVVRIPQLGGGESLNVAMAATILCFEAARQQRAALRHHDESGPRR